MRNLTLICSLLVLIIGGVYLTWRFVTNIDWELISTSKSPNDKFTVKHYRSQAESGHAPYGDHLIMQSWRSFPRAMQEEVFFAGYCGPEFSYTWVSNEEISIVCRADSAEGLQTVASVFQGIKLRVAATPAQ